jgi:hypothetical protein
MPDLEKSISEWRKQMLAAGIKTPVPLEELEIHLREEIGRQVKSGFNVRAALEIAARRIGKGKELKAEFEEVSDAKRAKQDLWNLVFPRLKLHERKYIYRALCFGGGLFIAGVLLCYFIFIPAAVSSSQMYFKWLGLGAVQWRAENYFGLLCKFMFGIGILELSIVTLTLVKIGVLNYSILAKARLYIIVLNLILGAVLTTPEILTQIIMFLPLQLLYEITVGIAWHWNQQERKRGTA